MPQSYSYKHQDLFIILNFTANSAVYTIKHKFSSDPHMFFFALDVILWPWLLVQKQSTWS